MKEECRTEFWVMTEKHEGKVFCFYLDVLGLVTTAIGNLCDDVHVAMSMPFYRPDGTKATPDDIRAEHTFVKAQFCGMKGAESQTQRCPWRALGLPKICYAHLGWKAASAGTKLRLNDEGVKAIVLAKMAEHDADLLRQYPAFESWPWQAQLATHSMAWACGSRFGGNHRGGFPRLKQLLLQADFAQASANCHINETGNPGVIPRNIRNKALYLEAAGLAKPTAPALDLLSTKGVQLALQKAGFDPGPIDGIPGKRTKAATVAFQSAHGLKPDGIVGPLTRAALAALAAALP